LDGLETDHTLQALLSPVPLRSGKGEFPSSPPPSLILPGIPRRLDPAAESEWQMLQSPDRL
jgi:hypothetical protein